MVIAGKRSYIEAAIVAAKSAGAKIATLLAMSVPSHCHLMLPAAERLRAELEVIPFSNPKVPVVNNVDVKPESSVDNIKSALVRQLYSPVRWVEIVQWMTVQGVGTIIECGPGKVLTGLIKRIDKNLKVFPTHQDDMVKEFLLGDEK